MRSKKEKLQRAKILDDILDLFKGNVTRSWIELQDQFKDQMNNYYIVENHIKFLIGEGVIREDVSGKLYLSPKGFAIYTNIAVLGYASTELERLDSIKKENVRFWAIFWITLVTLLVTIYQVFFASIPHQPKPQIEKQSGIMKQETPVLPVLLISFFSNNFTPIFGTDYKPNPDRVST